MFQNMIKGRVSLKEMSDGEMLLSGAPWRSFAGLLQDEKPKEEPGEKPEAGLCQGRWQQDGGPDCNVAPPRPIFAHKIYADCPDGSCLQTGGGKGEARVSDSTSSAPLQSNPQSGIATSIPNSSKAWSFSRVGRGLTHTSV